MGKKTPVSRAQVIESSLAVRRKEKTVLRTSAVAHGKYVAGFAKAGEGVKLDPAEGPLSRCLEQLDQGGFPDIPQAMFSIDEVVTGIEVALVLHHRHVATGLSKDTEAMFPAEGCRNRLLEDLNIDSADVLFHPLIENDAEKITEGRGRDRTRAYARVTRSFHEGQKPEESRPYLLEEPIHLTGVMHVLTVYHAQHVANDAVLP
jgi:hypothetical protein